MTEAKSPVVAADPAAREALLHVLRPSVDSMLALAKLLADNEENNLSAKQIDYAQTIYSAGTYLLGVLDDILAGRKAEAAGAADATASAGPLPAGLEVPAAPAARHEGLARPYRGRRSRRPDDGVVLVVHRDAETAAALVERLRANGYDGVAATNLPALKRVLDERRPNAAIIGTELEDGSVDDVRDVLEAESGSRRRPATIALEHAASIDDHMAQITRFLHGIIGTPLPTRRRILSRRRRGALELIGKKVLMVDGDIRHIYAVTGALEQQGMLVVHAETGPEGMSVLENHPDIDAILVDATLPEGYGTIRVMRAAGQSGSLPIIALTAKARLEDREDCIAAGASDYMVKPVNDEQLVALLRAWLLTPR